MKVKTNKKVVIPALMTVISIGLIGSVSGTVAWYQYNTRVSASYYGASAGSVTENLKLRVGDGEWKTELRAADIQAYLTAHGHDGSNLRPVTAGAQEKDEELGTLYRNPVYQHAKQDTWARANAQKDYITFPLELQVRDIDGKENEADYTELAKAVYLQNVVIGDRPVGGKKDISSAIRLHLDSEDVKALISKDGNDTQVHGALDLLNDGVDAYDLSEGYEDFGDERHIVDYGYDPANIDGYVDVEANLPDLLKKNDYFKVIHLADDLANDAMFQWNGSAWNAIFAIPGEGNDLGEVNEEADRDALAPAANDYVKVIYLANDLANDTYHQYLESATPDVYEFVQTAVAPASGNDKGEVDEIADLPVFKEAIYFASTDNKLFQYDIDGNWTEIEIVASSYAMDSADIIANDDDPDNIVGGEVLGHTASSVKALANLPTDVAVDTKMYVRDLDAMYKFDGTEWKATAGDNDKYFQFNGTEWVEVPGNPGVGTDLGEVDEEADRDALVPATSDFVKVTYAAADEAAKKSTLKINVTIFLEGWQKLDGSAVWNGADYIGSQWNVGMTFVCESR